MVDHRAKKKEEEAKEKKTEAEQYEAWREKHVRENKKYAIWTGKDGKRYTTGSSVRIYKLSNKDLEGVTVLPTVIS